MGKRLLAVIFAAVLLSSCHSAGPRQGNNNPDETPLRKIPQTFVDAWNTHDAGSIAALLADDADFVSVGAVWLHGRSDVATFNERMMTGRFSETQMKLLGTRVSFLSPDIAVIHWAWQMQGDRNSDNTLKPPRYGIMQMVVKQGSGGWLVESAENTPAILPSPPELNGLTPAFWFPDQ
jgi:uncharacterized protein (TIGR02246 family)